MNDEYWKQVRIALKRVKMERRHKKRLLTWKGKK